MSVHFYLGCICVVLFDNAHGSFDLLPSALPGAVSRQCALSADAQSGLFRGSGRGWAVTLMKGQVRSTSKESLSYAATAITSHAAFLILSRKQHFYGELETTLNTPTGSQIYRKFKA